MWQRICPLVLVSSLTASAAIAAPKAPTLPQQPISPLDSIETLTGKVQVRGDGKFFVVTLTRLDGAGRKQFEIETEDRPGGAIAFSEDKAEIHFWRGHLVVVAPTARKTLHFSVRGIDRFRRPRTDAPQLDGASALTELDELLRTNYELTRIETAVSIVSKNEQALRLPEGIKQRREETDYQDYGSGGGLGSCGSSCSTTCGDGSTCSATCVSPRCARCSCPASCNCS